ncbi:MAG: alpha-E domain-containing protein [Pseudomonadota bacterium]
MLGKTAGGVFWMFRYLERSENTARLVEAGFRIALTRPDSAEDEWVSVLRTAFVDQAYRERHADVTGANVVDYLLRDKANPSSVMSMTKAARDNARLVRTAITREVWEAINECWMRLSEALSRPVRDRDLPEVLGLIRQQSALVRGALHGTMLRNDVYDFARIGTFLERADNTARILDVKYYILLPTVRHIGSSVDNVQWETILRSVGGQRAFRWLHKGNSTASAITAFLMMDPRMPRSILFCTSKIRDNLDYLERDYGTRHTSHDLAEGLRAKLSDSTINDVFEQGLHETILTFIADLQTLGTQIETDYRFYG